ncbi:MAG: acetate--CoA ligase family protein [bacterium]
MSSGFHNEKVIPDLDLEPLFNPKSVAIIGCSQDFNKVNGRPLRFLLENNYQGRIYPVNPKYEEIAGYTCYPNIAAVPEQVDVVLFMVAAAYVENIMKECIAAGARSAIIFSSGFAELGAEGREAQERISQLAKEAGMPVLGPNCLGAINLKKGIPLSFSIGLDKANLQPGGLALVSQSGAMGSFILGFIRDANIGLSYWVTTGNEACLEASAVARYLLAKDDVSGVLIYLEEARDANGLLAAGNLAREVGKPLICLKVGRGISGKRAAMSHTGSIAGADEEYTAAFKKAGIVRAEHIEELFDFGIVFSDGVKPKGRRVAIVTMTGGGGVLAADRCEKVRLEVPELSAETQAKLAEIVPSFGAVANPVDMTGQLVGSPGLLKGVLRCALADPGIDATIVILGMQERTGPSIARDIVEVVKSAPESKEKPTLVAWMSPPVEAIGILREAKIPILYDIVRTVDALAALVDKPVSLPPCAKEKSKRESIISKDLDIRSLLRAKAAPEDIAKERFAPTEANSKAFLAELGFSIPKGGVARTQQDAVKLASEIGYPVVVKVDSPDIMHKSDAKAVKVGLKNAAEVAAAFDEIMTNSRQYDPKARINGVLVEEMVTSDSLQTIVGLKYSEKFGPMVMFGMGGIFVEVMKEFSIRMAPVTEEEALEMIKELKTAMMFGPFRGAAPRDVQAAAKAIAAVSEIGASLGEELLELDINPLFLLKEGDGVKVGDALIVLKGDSA